MVQSLMLESTERSPHRLADLGCGAGRHSLYAAALGVLVTAVDHDQRVTERLDAARGERPVTVIQEDVVRWIRRQRPSSLDAIICYDVLHQLSGRVEVIADALATFESRLQVGGHLVVSLVCDIAYAPGTVPAERFAIAADAAAPFLDRALQSCCRVSLKRKRTRMPNPAVRVAGHYRKGRH